MPLTLTQRDIEEAHRYARDAISKVKGVGQSDGALSRSTRGLGKFAAVAAGAAAAGLASGYWGSADLKIGGKTIPLDGVGGLAGLGVSVFMEDGSIASETLANFSSGVFAAFATKFGIGVGKSWSEGGGLFGQKAAPQVSGQAPLRMITGGAARQEQPAAPLSAQELAAMGQAVR